MPRYRRTGKRAGIDGETPHRANYGQISENCQDNTSTTFWTNATTFSEKSEKQTIKLMTVANNLSSVWWSIWAKNQRKFPQKSKSSGIRLRFGPQKVVVKDKTFWPKITPIHRKSRWKPKQITSSKHAKRCRLRLLRFFQLRSMPACVRLRMRT